MPDARKVVAAVAEPTRESVSAFGEAMNSYRIAPQSLIQLPRSSVNLAYRAFVRKFPCCACGRTWGIEFAHTGSRGLRQKAPDLDGVPLCRVTCHQRGPRAYHTLGRVQFEKSHVRLCHIEPGVPSPHPPHFAN